MKKEMKRELKERIYNFNKSKISNHINDNDMKDIEKRFNDLFDYENIDQIIDKDIIENSIDYLKYLIESISENIDYYYYSEISMIFNENEFIDSLLDNFDELNDIKSNKILIENIDILMNYYDIDLFIHDNFIDKMKDNLDFIDNELSDDSNDNKKISDNHKIMILSFISEIYILLNIY